MSSWQRLGGEGIYLTYLPQLSDCNKGSCPSLGLVIRKPNASFESDFVPNCAGESDIRTRRPLTQSRCRKCQGISIREAVASINKIAGKILIRSPLTMLRVPRNNRDMKRVRQ